MIEQRIQPLIHHISIIPENLFCFYAKHCNSWIGPLDVSTCMKTRLMTQKTPINRRQVWAWNFESEFSQLLSAMSESLILEI